MVFVSRLGYVCREEPRMSSSNFSQDISPLFQLPAITDPSGSGTGTSLFRGSITKHTNWQSLEGNQAKNVPGFATFKMVSYSIQLAN